MVLRAWYILSAFFLSATLLVPSQEVRGDAIEAIEQSWSEFFTMELEPHEIGYMCLGSYSNVAVRMGNKTVLFDPSSMIPKEIEALGSHKIDLVVYTHDHGDHFDKTTAATLFQQSAPHIVAESTVAKHLADVIPPDKLHSAESEQPIMLGDLHINPLKGKHIGPIMLFKLAVNGISVVHAGDSSYVPMKTMNAPVAFVPTGYPSPTCSPKKAYKMAADIKPQYAVAFHGDEREHQKFATLVGKKIPGTKAVIPQPYNPQKLAVH